MNRTETRRLPYYLMLISAILLIATGVVMLADTFNQYNALSLQRQDAQLENMAEAADASMATQLSSFREELRYVIGRRGFLEAEKLWHETGDTAELLSRMQENLIASNPLIHNMLAVQGETIFLFSAGDQRYYFPDGMEEALQPCFSGDGRMYLAIFEQGQHARFAVLLSMSDWYAELASIYGNRDIRLMLLGSQQRILLHTWQGQQHVSLMDELNEDNCDIQAVRRLVESRTSGQKLTFSYGLPDASADHVHEMRMTALPLDECTNGYFIIGLTCDYDETIRPMQIAAWGLIISGALVVLGVLLLILLAALLVNRSRQRDRELEKLIRRNEETQKLLKKTTELAHHQRLETIGTLTASIAHEFNNLLTPIMGYSILTLEGLPRGCDDLAGNVAEIYEASRKAKDIISRLNALSRKNAESTFTTLALHSIAEKAMQVAAPAQPPKVSTQLVNQAGTIFVSGNETQLSQLLLNLILNAYHAMEEKGGTVTLHLSSEGDQAVVQVQDGGIGIAPEVLPRIFDTFFSTKESGRGTGLGLAIVQQIAHDHHGSVEASSVPGQGSTFTLRLPPTNAQKNADS